MSNWSENQEIYLGGCEEELQYLKDANRGGTLSKQQQKDDHIPKQQKITLVSGIWKKKMWWLFSLNQLCHS